MSWSFKPAIKRILNSFKKHSLMWYLKKFLSAPQYSCAENAK